MLLLLEGLLQIEASSRASPRSAFEQGPARHADLFQLGVEVPFVKCTRGHLSIAQGRVSTALLEWLQGDPFISTCVDAWLSESAAARQKRRKCMGLDEVGRKHEVSGYTGVEPPNTAVINLLPADKPMGAGRIFAFARAFKQVNRVFFDDLTDDVNRALTLVPSSLRGENGNDLMGGHFSDTALSYGVLQIMTASSRGDPAHMDGAASLLHGGLTVWGSREVRWTQGPRESSEWEAPLVQRPGDFYLGNLCAPWHQVHHLGGPNSAAEPLCRGVASAQDNPVHVTCMLRTDAFAAARARAKNFGPTPSYHAANTAVARALAHRPLLLPSLEQCQAEAAVLAAPAAPAAPAAASA